jgi:hypothetical protein
MGGRAGEEELGRSPNSDLQWWSPDNEKGGRKKSYGGTEGALVARRRTLLLLYCSCWPSADALLAVGERSSAAGKVGKWEAAANSWARWCGCGPRFG